ncbi:hypothetical protein Gocc_2073 [Gaiella occulta]|uniref:Uncharacterized protein n=1 Tax=Gaiella occulta TaxID=1002870 RepID=A0A7M2YV71_9ACTN|nr:hypothetical protein [Gaiella occulta]RDI73976.1 hypothetical protein Gocc_2073 [Gaiella occulta]
MDNHGRWESTTRHRRMTLGRGFLMATVVAALAAPALAVTGKLADIPGFAGYAGKGPTAQPSSVPDLSRASKLVSAKLPSGQELAVWQAPNAGGGHCVFLDKSAATAGVPTTITGAGECSDSPPSQKWMNKDSPVSTNIDWAKTSEGAYGYEVTIEGRVDVARVAGLAVVSSAGAMPVALSHGYFVGGLAPSGASGRLAPGGPYFLVAYDRSGTEVGRQDLEKLIAATRPQ